MRKREKLLFATMCLGQAAHNDSLHSCCTRVALVAPETFFQRERKRRVNAANSPSHRDSSGILRDGRGEGNGRDEMQRKLL